MARASYRARLHPSRTVDFFLQGDIAGQVEQLFDQVREKALRPAAHAMATVLHDEMRARAPVDQGTLRDAIYRWFDERASSGERKTYRVGVNVRKAPHWWLVEHGHWRTHAVVKLPNGEWITLKDRPLPVAVHVPASPYLRPAIDAKLGAAFLAGRRRLQEKISEVIGGA